MLKIVKTKRSKKVSYVRYRLFLLSFVLLLLSAGLTFAQIYKWVDENGVTHFSDNSLQEISESENEESSMPEL